MIVHYAHLGERVEDGYDPGDDLAGDVVGADGVARVEDEGEEDVEEVPDTEGADEQPVARLHLQVAPGAGQNHQRQKVSWG